MFYCTFSTESSFEFSLDFVFEIISKMIISLSLLDEESLIFKNRLRCLYVVLKCLYVVLKCLDIEDFVSQVFKKEFRNINQHNQEQQNIVWEVLKVAICKWMVETDRFGKTKELQNKLKPVIKEVTSRYTEKNNRKFQEFLLV